MSSLDVDAWSGYAIDGISPQPLPSVPIAAGAAFDAFVDATMDARFFGTPAVAAGGALSIVKDGRVVAQRNYGVSDAAKLKPVDATTMFRIGSTSKLVTATAAMQLVEQGKLDLDADINRYLDISVPPMSLRNLLTHTAGFEENQLGYMLKRSVADNTPIGETLRKHMPAQVRPANVHGWSDRRSSYSSMGIVLIGYLIERVSGANSFDQYVEQNIFQRLGMLHSSFEEPLPPALAPLLSIGHAGDGKGGFLAQPPEWWHSVAPAGSMCTTATDMAQFMIAHLQPGRLGLFSDRTANLMQSRHLVQHPHVNGAALAFYESWINGRRLLCHRGKTVSFPAALALLPEENFGMFIVLNAQAPWRMLQSVIQTVLDQHFPATIPTPPARTFPGSARRYVGSYASNSHSYEKLEKLMRWIGPAAYETIVTATDEATLQCSTSSGAPDTLDEVARGVFKVRGRQDQVAFMENASGHETHMLGPNPFAAGYRLRWFKKAAFHTQLLKYVKGGLYAAIAWALLGPIIGGHPFTPAFAAALAAILHLTGFKMVWDTMSDLTAVVYGYPRKVHHALTQLLVFAGLTLIVAGCALAAWQLGWWNAFARIVFTAIAIIECAALWQLNYWRLIGYRYA